MELLSMLKRWQQTKDLSLASDICTYLSELYKIESIVLNEDNDDNNKRTTKDWPQGSF